MLPTNSVQQPRTGPGSETGPVQSLPQSSPCPGLAHWAHLSGQSQRACGGAAHALDNHLGLMVFRHQGGRDEGHWLCWFSGVNPWVREPGLTSSISNSHIRAERSFTPPQTLSSLWARPWALRYLRQIRPLSPVGFQVVSQ